MGVLFRCVQVLRRLLALDIDDNLTYLAENEWRLGHTIDKWPGISFDRTREHV